MPEPHSVRLHSFFSFFFSFQLLSNLLDESYVQARFQLRSNRRPKNLIITPGSHLQDDDDDDGEKNNIFHVQFFNDEDGAFEKPCQ